MVSSCVKGVLWSKIIQYCALPLLLGLAACSGGGGGSGETTSLEASLTPSTPLSSTSVVIDGTITYDFVPHSRFSASLSFSRTEQRPARGVTVELVDGNGTVLDRVAADENGNYRLFVDPNIPVRVRARAELFQSSSANWDVRVRDNTAGGAVYTLSGGLKSSGTNDSTRNLNAASGWTGAAYTETRAAAPFAILDSIYEAIGAFVAVDPQIDFPALNILWSVDNRISNTLDISSGDIGTSSYSRGFSGYVGEPTIVILGNANGDNDEFDRHVIVHEFGHFFEDQLSRSDSIGGSHSLTDRLDARLAFSEGWGNALSAMILGPRYVDSSGPGESTGFEFNIESDSFGNEGWYNELSVHRILYDIFDMADDGADTISAGLAPIYNTLISDDYLGEESFATVFSFLTYLETQPAVPSSVINALKTERQINGTGVLGIGETNDGGDARNLPVYKRIVAGGPAVEICSRGSASRTFNKLENRVYLVIDVPTGARTYTMTRMSGDTGRDPDFLIWRGGNRFAAAINPPAESETLTLSLTAGTYVIEAYDAQNIEDGGIRGDACYSFSVS